MGKLRDREFRKFARGHPANKWQCLGWELRKSESRAHALNHYSVLPHYIYVCFYENSLRIGAKFIEY